MKTQTISFIVLNPLPTFEPQVLINETVMLSVEEFIIFDEVMKTPLGDGKFIRYDDYYRVGITHNTEIPYENIWLVFPSLRDFLVFSVMKVAEINILSGTLIRMYENQASADIPLTESQDIIEKVVNFYDEHTTTNIIKPE